MISDKDNFDQQFEKNVKAKKNVNRNHVFDSRQTVITVGPKNNRYPFDTEEEVFSMSSPHPDCLKNTGSGKIKPTSCKEEVCGVCHKPKDKFKKQIM